MEEPTDRTTRLERVQTVLRDREMHGKAAKFAMIGAVNAAVDYAVFVAAYFYLGFSIVGANAVAWVVAVTGSYVLNTYFTFAAESGRVLRLKDYVGFAASGVAGFVANTLTVLLGSYLVPVLLAKLAAVGVSFVVNFSLSHFVVFPARRAAGRTGADGRRQD